MHKYDIHQGRSYSLHCCNARRIDCFTLSMDLRSMPYHTWDPRPARESGNSVDVNIKISWTENWPRERADAKANRKESPINFLIRFISTYPGSAQPNNVHTFFGFFNPFPLVHIWNWFILKIHATSLTTSAFARPPSPFRCGHHIWKLPTRMWMYYWSKLILRTRFHFWCSAQHFTITVRPTVGRSMINELCERHFYCCCFQILNLQKDKAWNSNPNNLNKMYCDDYALIRFSALAF